MSRSIWKEPFCLLKNQQFFDLLTSHKKCDTINLLDLNQNHKLEKTLQVWSRNSMILPEHVGKEIKIYNGKNWAFRKIVEEMVGHKFGEFCSTRKKTTHKINKIKQVARKK